MPTHSDETTSDKVIRKQAVYSELRNAFLVIVGLVLLAILGSMVYLGVQVYDLTKDSNGNRDKIHQDTVNIITGAAYCARKPEIHTYNQMIRCIQKTLNKHNTDLGPISPISPSASRTPLKAG